ncbi:MAG: hypothetical protein WC300_05425 [Candidatus Omnitrophota bacterium]|jgi:tRNA nucleotidyltransferase (CCA-adding enzyme)
MNAKDKLLSIPDFVSVILNEAGVIGDRHGFGVFAVGGFVRDLMLERKSLDIDIAVQGDGIRLAEELARRLNGSLAVFRHFGTAMIEADIGGDAKFASPCLRLARIDIATARSEHYRSPACYPDVRAASIKADLKRRDFSINAIALVLNARRFAQIIDYFNGMGDLENGVVRVMHEKSFIDDPTRIFRAVRFEQRYNFAIDSHTLSLIKKAVRAGLLCRLKRQRIEKELALFQKEDACARMAVRLEDITGERYVTRGQDE